ncbi:MAG: hypothetical protein AB1736_11565 [Chloroflexota bacterium]
MITFEAPCCDRPLSVESHAVEVVRCDECSVTWLLADAGPVADVTDALAA